jgi:hypothetical protein
MSAYIKKSERSQINILMMHLKVLVKQEQAKPKTSKRKEIPNLGAEINEIESERQVSTK